MIIFKVEKFFFTSKQCFEVTALDNSDVNPPVSLTLNLIIQIFDNQYRLQSAEGHVLTNPGLLLIQDNDGKCCFAAAVNKF